MSIALGSRGLVTLYWLLFLATVYVNKYVLSVLKFTYPTIFQGWQTLFGAVTLWLLSAFGQVDLALSAINRSSIAMWVPAMMMFVGSIYSGSVALAQLPVPVFLCLQNILLLPAALADSLQQKVALERKSHGIKAGVLGTISISCVAICSTDPQFSRNAYLWMLVHLSLSGGLLIYKKFTAEHVKLRDYEQIFCNYTYSMILLVPSSFLLGDTLAARKYPFLYFSKFYIGCLFSGVFGVLLNVVGTKLESSTAAGSPMEQHNTVARCLCAMMSLPIFEMILTAPLLTWVVINLLAAVLYFELPNILLPWVTIVTDQADS